MPDDTGGRSASQECTKCGEVKPSAAFYASRPGRLRRECKPCHLAGRAKWREANRPKLRAWYGVTDERYAELLAAQGGVCAICRQPETTICGRTGEVYPLAVDHDHRCCSGRRRCGKCVRGLLCGRCNRALGLLQDDITLVAAAVAYLTSTQTTGTAPG